MAIATSDLLDLPVPERAVFASPPLVLALCQVKFSPILSVSDPTVAGKFQQKINERYPVTSQLQAQNVAVHLEGDPVLSHASVQSNVGAVSWRFSDLEDTWTVVLTQESLALEARVYRDFAEFEDRLEQLLGALEETIRAKVGTRVGLRYVNEIRPLVGNWNSAIRSELLGALSIPQFGDAAAQSFQQLQLRQPDGVRVNMHHGIFPGGSVVEPRPGESPPETPFYLLDIDVFQEFSPVQLSMKPRAIRDHVQRYHEIISRLFRWSVTEDYMATLGRA